jgi:hypothetical protein
MLLTFYPNQNNIIPTMTNPPNNTIFQYVRNRRREKVGVVVATRRSDNTVGLGFSLCATNRGDTFNPATALEIAVGRAENFPHFKATLPQSVKADWDIIYDRACRYFKGCEVL